MLASEGALYIPLCEQAKRIVRIKFPEFDESRKSEIAHDITVDFLFFSHSFSEVYDSRRDLKPFFHSYVWRKCRGVRERSIKMKKRFINSEEQIEKKGNEDFMWIDLLDRLDYFHNYLSQFEHKGIDLSNLFRVVMEICLEEGRYRVADVVRRMGASRLRVRAALSVMKSLLKERIKEGF